MGVWIETYMFGVIENDREVTPCMGVWIETCATSNKDPGSSSHTLYGCVD